MKFNVINNKDVNNLNKLVNKDFNIVLGGDYNINNKILSNKKLNLLLDPEPLEQDYNNYRNSGLNQVLVKLAKKNNISIGFSLNRLNKLNNNDKIKLIGKIMQNIILCNKYKVNFYVLNFDNNKNINDLISLGISLGAKKVNVIQI